PEGQVVKKGELLVRLDSSLWENQRLDREIWLQQNEAGLVFGKENLKVTTSRTESEIASGELAVRFAREDLTKYIDGDFPNQIKERERNVAVAESFKAAAHDNLEGIERLYEQKFTTPLELDVSKRSMQRTAIAVELAEGRKELLKRFTYKRRVDQLESDLAEAERELERTRLRAAADLIKAETTLAKSEHWFRAGTKYHKKIMQQLKNCEIYAPADGTVMYAPRHEPLEEGQNAYDRQELIHLLTDSLTKAAISVGESDVGKVKIGQRVRITVDALPGEEFVGHVASIAILPDGESKWKGVSANVYKTEVFIDSGGSALRPGMSCHAEILVAQYQNTAFVPVEAVTHVNGRSTVYIEHDGTIEERTIEVGLANEKYIQVAANLSEGERVLVAPPLDNARVEHGGIFNEMAVEDVPDVVPDPRLQEFESSR
ncbi:MAG: efflux RND transporter periplasmic adaptor subunit, partial [Candidatus Hydrogenedentota bacterium]